MSESFKPFDPLCELDRLTFDLDFDLERAPDPQEAPPRAKQKVRRLPAGIRTLSNSPGCAPHASLAPESTTAASGALREDRPRRERDAESTSKAPAPAQTPQTLQPIRRARAVRVDAWAVPASANWTRTHKTARKIRRVSRSTDWALPF